MKNKKQFFMLVLILTMLSSIGILGQTDEYIYSEEDKSPDFERIGRDDGLSNLSVSSLIQDKYGFIWAGTQGGLNRYDGENIEVFRHDPFSKDGLIYNLIQTMFYDEVKHEIWIGTYQGISCYNIEQNRFKNYTVEDGLSNPIVVAFEKDANGDIWVGTFGGLDKLDIETETFTNYSVPGNIVRSLYIHNDETMYVGSTEGLFVYSSISDTLNKFEVELPSPVVMTIDEFSKDKLTLGLWDGGLAILDVKSRTVKNISFTDNRIYSVEKSADDKIWVGTWGGGLFSTQDGLINHYSGQTENSQLSNPVVYSLLSDDSGILWIGTNGGGLNLINPRKSDYVILKNNSEEPKSLSAGKINALFKDNKDRLWISVYNQGINIVEKDNSITKIQSSDELENPIPTDSIRVIKEYNNQIILGTDDGIGFYDYNQKAYLPWNDFQDLYIYDIEIVGDHEMWIGTGENGLYYYNDASGKIINYRANINENNSQKTSISDNHVADVYLDSKNRLWVATNYGLNLKRPGSDEFEMFFYEQDQRNQLAGNVINVIYEDLSGDMWFGLADGGLAKYNEASNNFTNITEVDGLSDNIVESILECENGNIWIATHSGITVFNEETSDMFVLLPEDGIGGYEFSKGIYEDDKFMYFTGAQGLVAIPKDYNNKDAYMPKMYITGITLFKHSIENNRYIYNDAQYTLGPEDDFLKFDFIALNYDHVNHLSYYYQLEGYDEAYIANRDSTTVAYSHLPPGDYTFRIYGKTNKDVTTEVAKVHILIKQHWYKTIYAYIVFSIAILFLIFLIFKLRESSIIKKKNEELAIVNKKLEYANGTLKDLSLTDGLTGVYNHRYFDEHLKEHLELAIRNKNTYISLIMIDIDNYKGINDKYGHVVGDKLLQKLSKVITEVLPRSTDILARFGGDEFVVVLYDTKIHGALIVAQRIRRNIEKCSIPYDLVYEESEEKVCVTASLGIVSVLADVNTSEESILQKADEALYKAKEQGKNKVVIYEDSKKKE